jgi:hypothetical protein
VNPVTYDILTRRIKQVGNLPAMPAILSRHCETLSQKSNQIDIDKVVEQMILGFTPAESGRILAELWRLLLHLSEVIEYHCRPQDQKTSSDVTVLVHAADLACQKLGMGYGYELASDESSSLARIWEPLCLRFPLAKNFREETYTQLFIHLVSEADLLADHIFTPTTATG